MGFSQCISKAQTNNRLTSSVELMQGSGSFIQIQIFLRKVLIDRRFQKIEETQQD